MLVPSLPLGAASAQDAFATPLDEHHYLYTRPKIPPASPDGASRSSWGPCLGVTIQIGACRWGQGESSCTKNMRAPKGNRSATVAHSRALVLLPADPSPLRPTVAVTCENVGTRPMPVLGCQLWAGVPPPPLSPAPRPPHYEHGKPLACMQGRYLPCGTIQTGRGGGDLALSPWN